MFQKQYKYFVIIGLIIITSFLNSCTTTTTNEYKDHKPLENKEYDILGSVHFEISWYGIIGISLARTAGISFPGNMGLNMYVIQTGGTNYNKLLEEARKLYPTADAVVDITLDLVDSNNLFSLFYYQRKYIMNGLAIRYVKENKITYGTQVNTIQNERVDGQVKVNQSEANDQKKLSKDSYLVVEVKGLAWKHVGINLSQKIENGDVLNNNTFVSINPAASLKLKNDIEIVTIPGNTKGKLREIIDKIPEYNIIKIK